MANRAAKKVAGRNTIVIIVIVFMAEESLFVATAISFMVAESRRARLAIFLLELASCILMRKSSCVRRPEILVMLVEG